MITSTCLGISCDSSPRLIYLTSNFQVILDIIGIIIGIYKFFTGIVRWIDVYHLDLVKIGALTFRDVDTEAFPLLELAKKAYSEGGGMCAVLNAADEIAVGAFLDEKIKFTEIFEIVEKTFDRMISARSATNLDDIICADKDARRIAWEYVSQK